jgi:hypothetical protein
VSTQWDSVGLSFSAFSGPIPDEAVTSVELLIVRTSTNKSNVTPRVKAVTVPEINMSWTIQRCYIAVVKLRSSPAMCFDAVVSLY